MDETTRQQLIASAEATRHHAYAPFSHYHVGAAVLGADGQIYTGCNVENASYGLTICAERNAVGQMVAHGCTTLRGVAVFTHNGGSPCGACRQVLLEFADDAPVFLVDEQNNIRETTLLTLLPDHFSARRFLGQEARDGA